MSKRKGKEAEKSAVATETTAPNESNGVGDETATTGDTPDVTTLLAQLDAAKQEAQKNLDGWQRTLAEFANYKRRIEREMTEAGHRGAVDTLVKLLPIIDDFERAMQTIPEEWAGHPWVNGITMVQRKLQKLLEDFQIEAIDPTGQPFDPALHEGVGMEDSDSVASGHVSATLQKGYVSNGRVLRPALVRVAN